MQKVHVGCLQNRKRLGNHCSPNYSPLSSLLSPLSTLHFSTIASASAFVPTSPSNWAARIRCNSCL